MIYQMCTSKHPVIVTRKFGTIFTRKHVVTTGKHIGEPPEDSLGGIVRIPHKYAISN